MRLVASLLGLVLWLGVGQAARILVVLPFPGKSHHIFATSIMKGLAARGHHVQEFSPFPPQSPIPNHTYVPLHTTFEKELGKWTYDDFITHPSESEQDFYGFKIRRIWTMNQEVCEDTFKDAGIQKLLNSDEKFDIVITESTFGQESLLALGHHFSALTVTIEPFIPWAITNWNAGNALSIASLPDLFANVFDSDKMTFKDRTMNFISTALTLVAYHTVHLPFQQTLVSRYFPYPKTPTVSVLASNVSLYLTNSHPTVVNYIQPYTPNIVPVGGLHISPAKTSLPQDIQTFLDKSKKGFVYFSLGTVVPVHLFPKDILQMFINIFKRLPHNVLWKIELDSLEGVSSNVKLVKWVPQVAVLEHPNCELFITHGGLFSHHEAIYAGVPTVGMPFFADQPYNLQYNVARGRGVRLDFLTLTEKDLYSAVTKVLTDPRYKTVARQLSRVYRDQPVPPLDAAMYWIEFLLRHGAAPLRPASTQLAWYKLILLDVMAAVALLVAVLFTLVRLVVRLVARALWKTPSQDKSQTKKKKKEA